MSIKIEVKMTKKAIFDFLLYKTYNSVFGIFVVAVGFINLVLGIQNIRAGDTSDATIKFLFALIFIVGMPVMLWFSAGRQASGVKMFQKPIYYEFLDEGLKISQDEMENMVKWDSLMKAVGTKSSIFLYQDKNRGLILPRGDMRDMELAVIEAISTHMDPSKVKIRR